MNKINLLYFEFEFFSVGGALNETIGFFCVCSLSLLNMHENA